MNITLRLFSCSLLAAITLSLTGCGGDWFVGKWAFDKETTMAQVQSKSPVQGQEEGGLLKDVLSGLQKGISQVVLSQFEGFTLEFTSTEMRRIKEGSGVAQTYKVIEKPTPDTRVIQYEDGEINTLIRTEKGMKTQVPGSEDLWMHFKPAE
ncbi:hypothetical protein VSU19_19540 [Verrucomicrobiales bacterium BCK34]|nr:hypothetical protein [Verrucomicrobiales bacterium BCK34]